MVAISRNSPGAARRGRVILLAGILACVAVAGWGLASGSHRREELLQEWSSSGDDAIQGGGGGMDSLSPMQLQSEISQLSNQESQQ